MAIFGTGMVEKGLVWLTQPLSFSNPTAHKFVVCLVCPLTGSFLQQIALTFQETHREVTNKPLFSLPWIVLWPRRVCLNYKGPRIHSSSILSRNDHRMWNRWRLAGECAPQTFNSGRTSLQKQSSSNQSYLPKAGRREASCLVTETLYCCIKGAP